MKVRSVCILRGGTLGSGKRLGSLHCQKRGQILFLFCAKDQSGSSCIGVAQSVSGPVTFVRTILEKEVSRDVLGTGHHSILRMPGQDHYLIAYHRFATPLADYPGGKGWYREVCLSLLTFDEEGFLLPVIV